jgi:hypothetical protein
VLREKSIRATVSRYSSDRDVRFRFVRTVCTSDDVASSLHARARALVVQRTNDMRRRHAQLAPRRSTAQAIEGNLR